MDTTKKEYPRYKTQIEFSRHHGLMYVVVDTHTGQWLHVFDTMLWADKKARELNENDSKRSGQGKTHEGDV